MRKICWLAMSAVLAVAVSGCGNSAGTGSSATEGGAGKSSAGAATDQGAKLAPPAAALARFLEALRTGDDDEATRMLSTKAREKTASRRKNLTPQASDTARIAVGKVDYVGDDGARVVSTWTDVDEDGKEATDQIVWVLRRELEGWRVAGVAQEVFGKLLILNFEEPDDMARQEQWYHEEKRRRTEADSMQAQSGEKTEKQIR